MADSLVEEMQQSRKDYKQRKHLIGMLKKLGEGVVIVEGKHDVAVLGRLGVAAVTYNQIERGSGALPEGSTIYILTDKDKGGEEKRERLRSALLAMNNGHTINEELGRRLLGMLHATSVEQIYGPAEEILEEK